MSKKGLSIYYGTAPKETHFIIARSMNTVIYNGICLNLYRGYNKIAKKLQNLGKLNLDLFLDNGSFERFSLFLGGKITTKEYFDIENCQSFFDRITKEYEQVLDNFSNPEKIILTVPEIIGNAELTRSLQEQYLADYRQLEKQYNIKVIVSLQFNPNSKGWIEEIYEGANWIRKNIPKNWIIGIPFGNDFKILQKKDNFKVIEKIFRTILIGYKVHLFACGTINKIKKFVMNNLDFVYSIDASSVNNWSKYAHYLSKKSHKVLDIRTLKGRRGSEITIRKALSDFEGDSKIKIDEWDQKSFFERFQTNLINFQKILINLLKPNITVM